MADLLLKGIPDGCESAVREMAAVAVERFLHGRDVKVQEAVTSKFQTDVDAFRVDNGLDSKYKKVVAEPK